MKRLFTASVRVAISGEECAVVSEYYKVRDGKTAPVGRLLEDVVQTAVDDLIARATLFLDKKAGGT